MFALTLGNKSIPTSGHRTYNSDSSWWFTFYQPEVIVQQAHPREISTHYVLKYHLKQSDNLCTLQRSIICPSIHVKWIAVFISTVCNKAGIYIPNNKIITKSTETSLSSFPVCLSFLFNKHFQRSNQINTVLFFSKAEGKLNPPRSNVY